MNPEKESRLFGLILAIAAGVLVAVGTIWPVPAAKEWVAGEQGRSGKSWLLASSRTPEEAAKNLGDEISLKDWSHAYNGLANKNQFTEFQFEHDLMGYYPSLRTQATVKAIEVFPLHISGDGAVVTLKLHWTAVVGAPVDSRNLNVERVGDQWKVDWPLVKEPIVPPQVVVENFPYWGSITPEANGVVGEINDAATGNVKLLDMHPIQRADGLVILGEVRNEDVGPLNISVIATLLSKDRKSIASEDCFDKVDHFLLPGQVTPFRITFPNQSLSDMFDVRIETNAIHVSGPTQPDIAVQNEKINPAPSASLSGELVNPTGSPISVVHVIGTLYDQKGNEVWMVDTYLDRALYPQTPTPFSIPIPEDLARKISSQRIIVDAFDQKGSI